MSSPQQEIIDIFQRYNPAQTKSFHDELRKVHRRERGVYAGFNFADGSSLFL